LSGPELWLVLAISLDGRLAPAAGGAAQLGGAGDRRALEEALAWADGCLIAAGTLRLHGSTCLIHQPDLLEQRRLQGRAPQPVAIAVSRSGQFSPDLPFFAQPLERWLLVPMATPGGPLLSVMADLDRASGPLGAGFQRQLPLQAWPDTLASLAAAGLQRLLLLGGAQLASSVLAADAVDGLQLTLCPTLLGGQHTWIPAKHLLPQGLEGAAWQLEQSRPLGGDEVLLRYRRARSA